MKLEIDIPEEMLESEILDAIISVDTDNKIIKKVHIEPRIDDFEVAGSEDVVSRQAAIDALGEKPLSWTEDEYELGLQNQWQSDVDAIKALPSAQTEPYKAESEDKE